MSEHPSQEEPPEEPLRLKIISIAFVYVVPAHLAPGQVEKLLGVVGKGSLNYLLELAARFRGLALISSSLVDAIEFPVEKNAVSEKALIEAKRALKSEQAKELVDELLEIKENKPLIIAEEECPAIHSIERGSIRIDYLDNFPYLRVEGPPIPFSFESIFETGEEAGFLKDSDVAELSKWVDPSTAFSIEYVLRFHGGFPVYTLTVVIQILTELELEVDQVNELITKLWLTIELFERQIILGEGDPSRLFKAFESALGFKADFTSVTFVPIIFAGLESDKSFEELVKMYPRQVAALATGRINWRTYSRRDAETDIKERLAVLDTDKLILTGSQGVVLTKLATMPEDFYEMLTNPFCVSTILAYDFALTALRSVEELINSLRAGKFKPRVLEGLREYVARLLIEFSGYYRLATSDPFMSIWRTTYRFQELHSVEDALKEVLRAIDSALSH